MFSEWMEIVRGYNNMGRFYVLYSQACMILVYPNPESTTARYFVLIKIILFDEQKDDRYKGGEGQ